jgi:hypothetical protein
MAKLFDIQDTTVAISNLTLSSTQGQVTHTGNYSITGGLEVASNVSVAGSLNVKTLTVENLVAANSTTNTGHWIYNTENELNGKGFSWAHGRGQTQLIYKNGNRIWSNATIDLAASSTYNIDDIPVLSLTSLGGSVTDSRLTTVGTLNSLNVAGDVNLGDFAFFNSTYNRLGLGTEEPAAAIDILDNNVNIVIGSPNYGLANIGTNSNHDLAIITDNQARITIKSSGEVNVAGNLSINGTLSATNIVTDSRIDRTQALQFLATKDTSIYGLGLVWIGNGATRQLIMNSNPDRLFTTENIDIAADRSYYIDSKLILSSNTLGASVSNSSLTNVGILQSLTVSGPTILQSSVIVSGVSVVNGVQLTAKGLDSLNKISLTSQNKEVVYGDINEINIGDKTVQTKPVKVFGPLSVNINNPDPTLQFSVNGDVNIGGRRFTTGAFVPTSGVFAKGDICWNNNPTPNSYVGWVCIVPGTPGVWVGFGMIGSQ